MNIINPFAQDEITFDEGPHTYTVNKTKQKLTSVSTLISHYSQPFDPDGWAAYHCAKKAGITTREMQKRWEDNKLKACARGTDFHRQAEHFINTGEILDECDKDIIEDFKNKVKFVGQVFSEVLLYSIPHLVAGTSDILEYFPETHSVSGKDFKTNKEISIEGHKGAMMKPPFDHLPDSSMSKYSLQLSTYLYLLELKGFNVLKDDLEIYWINPETRKIEIIPIPYRRAEAIELVNVF